MLKFSFKFILHVKFNCFSFRKNQTSSQIREFSFQLLHQKVQINAFAFFDVDYTLIFKVISIYVQFD